MLSRIILTAVMAAAMVGVGPAWADDGLVTVEVTGTGISKEDALKDAKRNAVEKGAGTFIFSQSEVRDFQLAKDTILAKSAGFIHSYKELSARESRDDGVWTVKISAVVSIQGVQDEWGVVQNLLKDLGRPKILVVVNERVDKKPVAMSTVQTKIEGALKDSGFALVDRDQLKEIDKKDLQAALAEDKPDKVQAIAKRFGAQIFIYGTADANRGNDSRIGNVDVATYEAQSNIKVFKSDTAEIMASVMGDTNRPARGVQRVPDSAAKQALAFEADVVSVKLKNRIIEDWGQFLTGGGEVKLYVEGIKFGQVKTLKAELLKIKNITEVNADFSNNIADCALQSNISAKDLAEKIDAAMGDILEITDVTQNVIKATYVGK